MEKSVYRIICENITPEGTLPEHFSLPKEPEEEIPWAPGAQDGVSVFHMGTIDLEPIHIELMIKAINEASDGKYRDAEATFEGLTEQVRALDLVENMQRYVVDHASELNVQNVFGFARYLILGSKNTECVKIGLTLTELSVKVEESTKEAIRYIGLYDEFTLYSVWNMLRWENGNLDIFDLARKVKGWGRIHAMESLEPENDEIRHWLLTEGSVNGVMNSYSSLVCWEKSGAKAVLFGDPTYEEYEGLDNLIDCLLDEGPVAGISKIEDREKVLLRFLEISQNYDLSADDYDTILSVKEWADKESETMTAVSAACKDVLESDKCALVIKEAVKKGKALRIAEEISVPLLDDLLHNLREDFDNNYYNCRYLMSDDEYVEPTLEVFRSNLPLSEMAGQPIDDLCIGKEFEVYDKLNFILQELDGRPYTGTDLVAAGLRSPVTRNRYRAAEVLRSWVEKEGIPLSFLSPELYEIARELYTTEVYDGVSGIIGPLIKGEIQFSANVDSD